MNPIYNPQPQFAIAPVFYVIGRLIFQIGKYAVVNTTRTAIVTTIATGKVATRETLNLAGGFITGRSKVTAISQASGIIYRDLNISRRIGIQARELLQYTASRTLSNSIWLGKIVGKMIVRDSLYPYYLGQRIYQFTRVDRLFIGKTSVIERATDTIFTRSNKLLGTFGLQPSKLGLISSTARIGLVGGLIVDRKRTIELVTEGYDTTKQIAVRYIPALAPSAVVPARPVVSDLPSALHKPSIAPIQPQPIQRFQQAVPVIPTSIGRGGRSIVIVPEPIPRPRIR